MGPSNDLCAGYESRLWKRCHKPRAAAFFRMCRLPHEFWPTRRSFRVLDHVLGRRPGDFSSAGRYGRTGSDHA
ncbi:hypothetical protein BDU57DRAFT_518684 [Ampelomyces quisqualis]|uniref:Uncharacterized protein n=1 Tax=Ampelomyces quisqualis TaxID=50730 RepID=A0A6A5QL96_AMPQU|nr:hypothetical protein BDU57DRAFT_518684 [Ampelomyces quisqualis]